MTLIYVPSLKLNFIGERTLQGKNWYETHKKLQSDGKRMPTPFEFLEFLKYVKENNQDIYKEITEVRSPWRANWLDANFKVINEKLHINSNHILDSKGNLVRENSEVLDKNTLMEDRTPGISLEDYILENHTYQGLPNKNVKSGDLSYWLLKRDNWLSRRDNNSVAVFGAYSDGAYLSCKRGPASRYSELGVFAIMNNSENNTL